MITLIVINPTPQRWTISNFGFPEEPRKFIEPKSMSVFQVKPQGGYNIIFGPEGSGDPFDWIGNEMTGNENVTAVIVAAEEGQPFQVKWDN